jgi:hypothetical protein
MSLARSVPEVFMFRHAVVAGAVLVGACTQAPDSSESTAQASAATAPHATGAPSPERPVVLTPEPEFTEVTIPADTSIALVLETAVASDTSRVEDKVRARLAKPIVVDERTVVPEGAEMIGSVVTVARSGRVKGRASLAIHFHQLSAWNTAYDVETRPIARRAAATKGEDATKIGVGAGAGAVIGAVARGKKGAAIGSAIGGGAGAGVVMATRGDEVRLGPGATLQTATSAPVTIRVPTAPRL